MLLRSHSRSQSHEFDVIPTTSEWILDSLTSAGDGHQCTIIVSVTRSALIYLTQQFMPGALIVLCGLGALWLEPLSPPLVGGRELAHPPTVPPLPLP